MPPTMLPSGIVLDPHDAGAQQLQAHAERLELDDIHVVRARIMGQSKVPCDAVAASSVSTLIPRSNNGTPRCDSTPRWIISIKNLN